MHRARALFSFALLQFVWRFFRLHCGMWQLITGYVRWLLLIYFLIQIVQVNSILANNYTFFHNGPVANEERDIKVQLSILSVGLFMPHFFAVLTDNTIGRFNGFCVLFGITFVATIVNLILTIIEINTDTSSLKWLSYVMLLIDQTLYRSSSIFFPVLITDQLPRTTHSEQREGVFGVCSAIINLSLLIAHLSAQFVANPIVRIVQFAVSLMIVGGCAGLFWRLKNEQSVDSLLIERNQAARAVLVYIQAVKQCILDVRKLRHNVDNFSEETFDSARRKRKTGAKQENHVWEYTQTFLDRAESPEFSLGFIAHVYHMQQLSLVCIFLCPCWMLYTTFHIYVNSLDLNPVVLGFIVGDLIMQSLYYFVSIFVSLLFPIVVFPIIRKVTKRSFSTLYKLAFANVCGAIASFGLYVVWRRVDAHQPFGLVDGMISMGVMVNEKDCRIRLKSAAAEVVTNFEHNHLQTFAIPPGDYELSVPFDAHAKSKCALFKDTNITVNTHSKYQFLGFIGENTSNVYVEQKSYANSDHTNSVLLTTCIPNLCASSIDGTVLGKLPRIVRLLDVGRYRDLQKHIIVHYCGHERKYTRKTSRLLTFDMAKEYGSRYTVIMHSPQPCNSVQPAFPNIQARTYRTSTGYYVSTLSQLPIFLFQSCTESLFLVYGIELMYSQALPALRLVLLSIFCFAGVGGVTVSWWLHDSSHAIGTQMLLQTGSFVFCAWLLYYMDMNFDYLHNKVRKRNTEQSLSDVAKTLLEDGIPKTRTVSPSGSIRHRRSTGKRMVENAEFTTRVDPTVAPPPVILRG